MYLAGVKVGLNSIEKKDEQGETAVLGFIPGNRRALLVHSYRTIENYVRTIVYHLARVLYTCIPSQPSYSQDAKYHAHPDGRQSWMAMELIETLEGYWRGG